MKKKIYKRPKGIDFKRQKRSTTGTYLSYAADLLRIANQLSIQTRKAENTAIWCEKSSTLLEQEKNEPLSILKAAQAQRDSGIMENDQALSCIFLMVERLADDIIPNDPKLRAISAKIDAIEKREGLAEDEYWMSSDPNVPADWQALIKKWERCHNEIIVAILKQCGEYEIANLFLNRKEEFDLQFETGRCIVFKGRPDQ